MGTQMPSATAGGVPERVVVASHTRPGMMVVHHIVADQAGGADKDVVIEQKFRVIDVVVIMKAAGGAGDGITIKNGATAITDTIDVSGSADKVVKRPLTIDDAQYEIAAGGTLRVTKANGANDPSMDVYVVGVLV